MPCDASGMAEIHRLFKHGFGEGPDLVRRVAEGDVAHAAAVVRHLATLSTSLHAHHEFEDDHVWDPLTRRAPACALHVERMKEQHAQMLVHLEALDAALPVWGATARAADAAPVVDALEHVNEALSVHLPDEETTIVPTMEEVLEQRDMDAASRHGRRATPKGRSFPMLGAILAAQPDGGEEWLRKHLPAPGRAMWRLVGRRRYQADRDLVLNGPR